MFPLSAAAREFGVTHFQFQFARFDIEFNQVAFAHQRQRPADVRLRRHMQHAGAVRGAAHARVRNTHHVAHAFFQQLFRNRQLPPFRHAGAAERAAVLQHQHGVFIYHQAVAIDPRVHFVVILEHHRRTGVFVQMRFGSGGLDYRAVGREVAAQHRQPAGGRHRIGARANHIFVINLAAREIFAQCLAVHRLAIAIE